MTELTNLLLDDVSCTVKFPRIRTVRYITPVMLIEDIVSGVENVISTPVHHSHSPTLKSDSLLLSKML
jgi:hypothetical protein